MSETTSKNTSNKSSQSKDELLILVNKLLALANQIVKTDADFLLVVEEYARDLAQLEPQLTEASQVPELGLKLKELEDLHTKVMEKVASDKDKIRASLTNLKKKGKVALTYTDQLPKRISLSTRKKV